VAADPSYWRASFNAGLLLSRERRFREAAAAFEAVLAQVPDHAAAHYELGVLEAGPLGNPAQAREHLRRALEAEPDDPRAARIREILNRL
jgi:tetratricopeptide (TPR) repeat protein